MFELALRENKTFLTLETFTKTKLGENNLDFLKLTLYLNANLNLPKIFFRTRLIRGPF